jgi:hypothetical protein
VLGAGEHQHLEPLVLLDQEGEQFALDLLRAQVHRLGDQLGGGVATGHFDEAGLMQQAVGEGLDLVREGGREQQVLALLGEHREDFLDVADEAHVEHAVGFVQHQDFHAGQIDGLLVAVVEQAARGGHEDIDALLELGDLRVDGDATEHDHRGQRQVLAVGLHRFFHLGGEFARRGEDQAARLAGLDVVGVGLGQDVQDRQREAGGLAGAGLGGGEQVAAGEHQRNGLGLDRGGRGVAGFGNRLLDGGAEREVGKADCNRCRSSGLGLSHGFFAPATA